MHLSEIFGHEAAQEQMNGTTVLWFGQVLGNFFFYFKENGYTQIGRVKVQTEEENEWKAV